MKQKLLNKYTLIITILSILAMIYVGGRTFGSDVYKIANSANKIRKIDIIDSQVNFNIKDIEDLQVQSIKQSEYNNQIIYHTKDIKELKLKSTKMTNHIIEDETWQGRQEIQNQATIDKIDDLKDSLNTQLQTQQRQLNQVIDILLTNKTNPID